MASPPPHRLLDILDAMPAGVVQVDRSGAIELANATALEVLGLTREDLLRRVTMDFEGDTFDEEGRPFPVERYPVSRALATGESQPPVIIGVRRPDGTARWSLYSAMPVRGDTGEVTSAVVTFLDVTAQRQAQLALRASEERLTSVLDSAPNIIATTDHEGRIRFVNRIAHGLRRDEVIGTNFLDFIGPDHRERVRTLAERVLRQGEHATWEVPIRGDLGSTIYATVAGPLRDGGRIVGMTIVTWDVTDQRNLQARIATADRMASLGTLSASVAHDINNPLAYVLGSLDWCVRAIKGGTVDAAALLEPITAALEGASRIRTIVRDLKTFAQPRAASERADLRSVLELALRIAGAELACRARVETDFAGAPETWSCDARFGQVFVNLLVNAAQAIPVGQVAAHRVRVTTGRDVDGFMSVRIEDSGCGIEPELLDRIFEPFVTTKTAELGTGLGLFICRTIVASRGGTISVESTVGKGSTFLVRLPEGTMLPTREAQGEGRSPRAPLSILIADDEPRILELVSLLLPGDRVTCVRTGREALSLLEAPGASPPDVFLCDLVMPDLTGMDVYELLRRRGRGEEKRFVLITGGGSGERLRAFVESAGVRLLEKPFTALDLEEAIASVVPAARTPGVREP